MRIQPIILAAGNGTRMNSPIPKVLIPLAGKPIIQHLIDTLQSIPELDTPLIVVGKNAAPVKHALDSHMLYAKQDTPQGTGHALAAALPHVQSDHILVCYGDHPLLQANTIQAYITNLSNKPYIRIGTVTAQNFTGPSEIFNHWGRVIRNADNMITHITEYKDASHTTRLITEVNASPYCFNTKWTKQNINTLAANNTQGEYYLTDLIELASTQNIPIQSIDIPHKQALGVNTPDQLEHAETLVHKETSTVDTPNTVC